MRTFSSLSFSRILLLIRAALLVFFLFFVFRLHAAVPDSVFDRVTMSQKDVTLSVALDEIERQTGYHYFMNAQWEADAKKVSIEVTNADLKTVLDICFRDQPFTYEIVGKTIVIKQRESTHLRDLAIIF